MDLDNLFANDTASAEKVKSLGFTMDSLKGLVNEIGIILQDLENCEAEDFMYRLKICQEKNKGKEVDNDPEGKRPSRVSVMTGKDLMFFRVASGTKSYKKSQDLFACENCAASVVFKNIKNHACPA